MAWSAQFAPWGWAIGTGEYIDDIQGDLVDHIRIEAVALIAILLVAGALTVVVARSIVRPLRVTMDEMSRVAEGDLAVEVHGTERNNFV